MKKFRLTALAVFLSLSCFAQKFELTPNGIVNSQDHTKNYVVIEIPDLSKDEIFTKAHQYITTKYISPQDVMSVSGTDLIAINGFLKAPYNDGMHNCDANIRYRINLSFKDGRFKIEYNTVSMEMYYNHRTYPLSFTKKGLTNGLFKKDGSLTKGGELAKPAIISIPNGIIDGIKNNQVNSEDW